METKEQLDLGRVKNPCRTLHTMAVPGKNSSRYSLLKRIFWKQTSGFPVLKRRDRHAMNSGISTLLLRKQSSRGNRKSYF